MRRILPLLALLATAPLAAQHDAHRDSTWGSHGMVLFGERGQFLSHLPLYRAPHDWQMLLRVSLVADSAGDPLAVLRHDRGSSGHVLYTIEPEEFAHSGLAAGTTFRATLFRGHFERGGTPILRGARFRVEQVLYRRRLEEFEANDPAGRFLVLKDVGEAYLLRRIGGAPDADHIHAVELAGDLPPGVTELNGHVDDFIGYPRAGDRFRLENGKERVRVKVLSQIYFEEGDLEGSR